MMKYFVIIIIYLSSVQCMIKYIVPPPDRCWHINYAENYFGKRIVKELQEAYQPIIIMNISTSLSEDMSKCDSFMFIRKNYEEIRSLFLTNFNLNRIVDNKVLLVYEGQNDVSNTKSEQFMNSTVSNVLLLRIHRKISGKLGVLDDAITELHALAPLSGRGRSFHGAFQDNYEDLEDLFKSQKWDPLKRDVTLVAAYHYYDPFVTSRKGIDGTEMDGIEYRLVTELTKDWKIGISPFNDFENNSDVDASKGRWTLGQVFKFMRSGKADIALIGLCLHMKSDKDVVSQDYDVSSLALLVPKPRPVDAAAYLYLPLSGASWITFIACFFVSTGLLNYFARIENFIYNSNTDNSRSPYRHLVYCFMILMDITCAHGVRLPKQHFLRTILFNWTVASLLVTTYYLTGYSSFMAKQKYTERLKTFKDMIEADVRWRLSENHEENIILKHILGDSNDYYRTKFTNINVTYAVTSQEGYRGQYAAFNRIISHKYAADYKTENDFPMELLKEDLTTCPTVFLLSPQTPFRQILDARILAALAGGLIGHWTEQFVREGITNTSMINHIISERTEPVHSLTLANLKGAFRLLLLGYVMSTILLSVELLSRIYTRRERLDD